MTKYFVGKKATYFLSAKNSCYDVYFYVLLTLKKKIHSYSRHYFFSKSGKTALDINLISRCTQFSDMAACVLSVSRLQVK